MEFPNSSSYLTTREVRLSRLTAAGTTFFLSRSEGLSLFWWIQHERDPLLLNWCLGSWVNPFDSMNGKRCIFGRMTIMGCKNSRFKSYESIHESWFRFQIWCSGDPKKVGGNDMILGPLTNQLFGSLGRSIATDYHSLASPHWDNSRAIRQLSGRLSSTCHLTGLNFPEGCGCYPAGQVHVKRRTPHEEI